MKEFLNKTFLLMILFLAGCSETNLDNPSSFTDSPLNLNVGDCFNDFSNLDMDAGSSVDAQDIEVVGCSNAHNGEVFAAYSSVPLSYRDSSDPLGDMCIDGALDLIDSLFPNASYPELSLVYEKFDNSFQTQWFYNKVGDSYSPDLDNKVVCTISSNYNLTKTTISDSIKELNQ